MDYSVIIASILVFLVITFVLVGMLLGAKAKLLPSGPVSLLINGDNDVEVSSGSTLLTTLGNNKIFLPSACGGGGTCIQCKCQILEGGGEILPTEAPHFTRKEIADGWRLGCQVKVKQNMVIQVPEEVFGIKKWEATVVRNWNVASFIKEFVVEIPEAMDYKAAIKLIFFLEVIRYFFRIDQQNTQDSTSFKIFIIVNKINLHSLFRN